MNPFTSWGGFALLVLVLLAVDLGFMRGEPTLRRSAAWSAVWVTLALLFGAGVYLTAGAEAGLAFFTGYLVEKALSVDNLFVWALIFGSFGLPRHLQRRVLTWGILGALVMRGAMVGVGAFALQHLHALLYLFGALLVVAGLRTLRPGGHAGDPRQSRILRWLGRLLPVTDGYRGQRFFVREAAGRGRARLMATPLLAVLVLVEVTDVVFAVDSIPAIFGVTRDPFLVYSSNVFAILGLRALFFVVTDALGRLRHLKPALAAVLVFIGGKMMVADLVHVPTGLSLLVVAGILAAAVGATGLEVALARRRQHRTPAVGSEAEEPRPRRHGLRALRTSLRGAA